MYNKKSSCYLIFILILSSHFALAQQSVNASGNKATGTSGNVNYSIGQVFYHHLNGDNNTLSEGVQYGYSITNSIGENSHISLTYSVYPNPTKSNFSLSISEFISDSFSYILYDINGTKINQGEITNSLTDISLSKYNNHTFLLTVFKNKGFIKSFTIIKN